MFFSSVVIRNKNKIFLRVHLKGIIFVDTCITIPLTMSQIELSGFQGNFFFPFFNRKLKNRAYREQFLRDFKNMLGPKSVIFDLIREQQDVSTPFLAVSLIPVA